MRSYSEFKYVTHVATTTQVFDEFNPRLDLIEKKAYNDLLTAAIKLKDAMIDECICQDTEKYLDPKRKCYACRYVDEFNEAIR